MVVLVALFCVLGAVVWAIVGSFRVVSWIGVFEAAVLDEELRLPPVAILKL
jgi:hypothetical protein